MLSLDNPDHGGALPTRRLTIVHQGTLIPLAVMTQASLAEVVRDFLVQRYHIPFMLDQELIERACEIVVENPDLRGEGKRFSASAKVADVIQWEDARLRIELPGLISVDLLTQEGQLEKRVLFPSTMQIGEIARMSQASKPYNDIAYHHQDLSISEAQADAMTAEGNPATKGQIIDRSYWKIVHSMTAELFAHVIDSSLPGGLRRLASEMTLAEAGVRSGSTLMLLSENLALANLSIVSKSTLIETALIDLSGQMTRLELPADERMSSLRDRIQSLSQTNRGSTPDIVTDFGMEFISFPPLTSPPPGAAPPTVSARVDTDIFSGPDAAIYTHLGILPAGHRARVTGRSADGRWWQVVVPGRDATRGWVQSQHTTATNIQNVGVAPAPRQLLDDDTLWRAGARQDTINVLQLYRRLTLVDMLTQRYHGDWHMHQITVTSGGLLIGFQRRDKTGSEDEIYLRALDNALFFQVRLLSPPNLTPIATMALYEHLQRQQETIAPLRLGIDAQQSIVLQFSTTLRGYRQAEVHQIDPLVLLSESCGPLRDRVQAAVARFQGDEQVVRKATLPRV